MKPVSFIIAMHVHFPDSEKEYNHVCSSRCAVYIYDSLESFIPYSILINFEDENYRIFFSNVDQRYANFLRRFLRAKKYSLPLAQNMLLKYLNLRQTFPNYFYNLDFLSPSVNQLINSGYLIPSLKRDKYGRRIIFGFADNLNSCKYSNIDLAKVHIITYETLLCDELTQIAGVIHFGDCHGSPSPSVALSLFNPREFFLLFRWGEHSLPMRHSECHFINVPTPVRYIFEFFQKTLTDKMRQRIKLHSSKEKLYEHIDLKLFPKEYGGVTPIAEMIEVWKKELMENREKLLSLDKMKLLNDADVCLRKRKILTNKNSNNDIQHINGTFRKLDID
ncbi:hypothetical protein PGB90_006176 [Kerria lacca]